MSETQRALSFDSVADSYDRARFRYNEEIVNQLLTVCGTSPRILEVGSGTGQLSTHLAQYSSALTCVEPGAEMFKILQRELESFPQCNCFHSTFEEFDTKELFDVVVSAQAWHWVDPAIAYQKAFELLDERGVLALIWYRGNGRKLGNGDDPTSAIDAFCEEAGISKVRPAHRHVGAIPPELQSSDIFTDVRLYTCWAERELDCETYLELWKSQSPVATLAENLREKLLQQIKSLVTDAGGSVHESIEISLVTARARK